MKPKTLLISALLVGIIGAATFMVTRSSKWTTNHPTCVVALESTVNTLDPMRATEVFSGRVVAQIYEGLVGLDAQNSLVPVLAESWSLSDDHKVWTFKIRSGVQFHRHPAIAGGQVRILKASDAVFCLTRLLNKESPFAFAMLDVVKGAPEYNAGKAKSVTGITAPDDMTLRMELVSSDPFLLNRMTSQVFGIYPAEAAQLGPDRFGTEVAVGTGPFVLVGTRRDDNVRLERNSRYWKSEHGNIEKLEFRVIQNSALCLADVRNEHVDLAWLQSEQMRDVFTDESLRTTVPVMRPDWAKRFVVNRFSTFNSHFLALNDDKFDEAFRRAVSFAVNRGQIVEAVTFGSAKVTPGPLPLAMHGFEPAYATDIHDVEKAKAALAQSRFNPQNDALEILVHDREGARAIGEMIQAQLQPLGVRVRLVELGFNEVFTRIIQGNYQGAIMFLEYVFSTPLPILDNFFTPGKLPNLWRFNNHEFNDRVTAMKSLRDAVAMNHEAQSLEKVLVDRGASAFLFQRQNVVLHNTRLSDILIDGHSMLHLGEAKMEP